MNAALCHGRRIGPRHPRRRPSVSRGIDDSFVRRGADRNVRPCFHEEEHSFVNMQVNIIYAIAHKL